MKIKFNDIYEQDKTIVPKIIKNLYKIIKKSDFILGNEVKIFEENLSKFIGTKYCISCANGTDSLEILLKAIGVGTGDEVLVPAISWISTSEAVSSVGGVPVFVDIDPKNYTIDTNLIGKQGYNSGSLIRSTR